MNSVTNCFSFLCSLLIWFLYLCGGPSSSSQTSLNRGSNPKNTHLKFLNDVWKSGNISFTRRTWEEGTDEETLGGGKSRTSLNFFCKQNPFISRPCSRHKIVKIEACQQEESSKLEIVGTTHINCAPRHSTQDYMMQLYTFRPRKL